MMRTAISIKTELLKGSNCEIFKPNRAGCLVGLVWRCDWFHWTFNLMGIGITCGGHTLERLRSALDIWEHLYMSGEWLLDKVAHSSSSSCYSYVECCVYLLWCAWPDRFDTGFSARCKRKWHRGALAFGFLLISPVLVWRRSLLFPDYY